MEGMFADMPLNLVYYLNKDTVMSMLSDFNGFLKIEGSLNIREGSQPAASHYTGTVP